MDCFVLALVPQAKEKDRFMRIRQMSKVLATRSSGAARRGVEAGVTEKKGKRPEWTQKGEKKIGGVTSTSD